MEQTMQLKAEMRTKAGTLSAKRARSEGMMPAVVYGHGEEAAAVTISAHDFAEALHHGHRVFEMDIDGKKDTVMIKDLQYDHLGRDVIHADLIRVDIKEMVTVTVPIALKGTAKGVEEGGILQEQTSTIDIKCRVNQIPDSLPVSVKNLEIGDSIHASEVQLPDGIELDTDPDTVIVTVTFVAEEEEEEEGVEEMEAPEVIGKGKEEEEEGEESPEEE